MATTDDTPLDAPETTDEYDGVPQSAVHGPLVSSDDTLSSAAEQLPMLREWLNDRPDTAATWTMSRSPVDRAFFSGGVPIEFVGAWRAPEERYTSSNPTRYVNPNYEHAHRYTDHIVECECGATISRVEPGNYSDVDAFDDHENCKPQWRLEAAADLARTREADLKRLYQLGWRGPEIAPRFGICHRQMVYRLIEWYGLDREKLRDEYRRLAGNTYRLLVDNGVGAQKVADVYDHAAKTLIDWYNEHGDLYDHWQPDDD